MKTRKTIALLLAVGMVLGIGAAGNAAVITWTGQQATSNDGNATHLYNQFITGTVADAAFSDVNGSGHKADIPNPNIINDTVNSRVISLREVTYPSGGLGGVDLNSGDNGFDIMIEDGYQKPGGSFSVNIAGLTSGSDYTVQFWSHSENMTLDGLARGMPQWTSWYDVGTFTADATTQAINMAGGRASWDAFMVTGLVGAPLPPNLIQNPGFEADYNGDSNPDNWTRTGLNKVKDYDLDIAPYEGNFQFQLQNTGSLSQQVVVPSAGEYDLSMFIASRPNGTHHLGPIGSDQVKLQLRDAANAIIAPDSAVTGDYDSPRGAWVEWTRTYDNLAAGTYTVELRSDGPGAGANQGMVDLFALRAAPQEPDDGIIPEPATMLAVFAGIAGIGGYVRRRRRACA